MAVLMGVLGVICMDESSKAKGALSVTMRKGRSEGSEGVPGRRWEPCLSKETATEPHVHKRIVYVQSESGACWVGLIFDEYRCTGDNQNRFGL